MLTKTDKSNYFFKKISLIFILTCFLAIIFSEHTFAQKRAINLQIRYNGKSPYKGSKFYFDGYENQAVFTDERGAVIIEVPESYLKTTKLPGNFELPDGNKWSSLVNNIPDVVQVLPVIGPEYDPNKKKEEVIAKNEVKEENKTQSKNITDNKEGKKEASTDGGEKDKINEDKKKEDISEPKDNTFSVKYYDNEFRTITDKIQLEKKLLVKGNNEIKQRITGLLNRLRGVESITPQERDSLKIFLTGVDNELNAYSAAYQESQEDLRNALEQIKNILYEQEGRIRINNITIFALLGIIAGLALLSYVFFIINKRVKKQREVLAEKVREINWQKEQIRIQRDSLNISNKQLEITTTELSEKIEEVNLQKEEIRKQRDNVEQKSQELESAYTRIQDSVIYAKRIQNAFLVNPNHITEHFKDAFVFHSAKDIVSGDFYWFSKKGDETILAVVDCTGHGVPGAFMTIMGNTLLDQIVNDNNITNPTEILKNLDVKIQSILHQQGNGNPDETTNDGMDMFVINVNAKKKKAILAGAKSSLYYVQGKQLQQIKGSKFPIGSLPFKEEKVFESQSISLKGGEIFYLFTDGFQDQFGSDEKGKYLKTRFRDFLHNNSSLPLNEQFDKLKTEFDAWRKDQPQTDDVLVVGIKV